MAMLFRINVLVLLVSMCAQSVDAIQAADHLVRRAKTHKKSAGIAHSKESMTHASSIVDIGSNGHLARQSSEGSGQRSFLQVAEHHGVEKLHAVRVKRAATWPFSASESNQAPRIVQTLVLTIDEPESKKRLQALLRGLAEAGLSTQSFNGVDAHNYNDEAEEMAQDIVPMTQKQRDEWMLTTFGGPPIHKGKNPEEFPSNGALACSLGHHHLWELAVAAAPDDDHAWTLILEDDARMHGAGRLKNQIDRILASAPSDVHIVHLDDRHCKYFDGKPGIRGSDTMNVYAGGSTAYAVTTYGAKMLLSEPFRYGADHWLNIPVHEGKMKALCPNGPAVFTHEYKHNSTIINNPS